MSSTGVVSKPVNMSIAAACRGRNGYTGTYWFGAQYAANSCCTPAIIHGVILAGFGVGTYAAAAALTGIGLPLSEISGVIAALIGLGAGVL